jgi:hypothetical protein
MLLLKGISNTIVSFSIHEVACSIPACTGRVKPRTFKIGVIVPLQRERNSGVRITSVLELTHKLRSSFAVGVVHKKNSHC